MTSRRGLRRHIPEIAVRWDLEAPGQQWRGIDASLCFADISGFTALTERLARRGRIGAEELVETLSRVFGAMLEMADRRGGQLLKFGGDALLFLFDGDGHPTRAAAAAVEMRAALREAAAVPTSVGRLHLSMSVGIHSGTIDLFLVGSPHRELLILGPGATAVAAAEKAAEAGEIVVSPETAARLPADAVRPRDDGELVLRWRRPPMPPEETSAFPEIDEDTVRSLFPRHLGEVLAPGAPDPEHRLACISFIRFSGTDALLAEQGPEALARALDETVGVVASALDAEGVTLLATDLDLDGGKFFCGSGIPHSTVDDEGRMLRALRRIADTPTPLPLQLGVNRGHVFAAEVGTWWRAAYSGMGDTTNTAARIMSKAPIGGLYAHPSVLEHSRTLFDATPAGPFLFKGKSTPMVVYEVGQERGTRTEERLGELPLLGREPELDRLLALSTRLSTGLGLGIKVTGATGLGKTRLLRELLDRIEDAETLSLRAEPYGATSAYRMFRDPLRAIIGIERADAETMAAALVAGLHALDPELVPFAALLGDVVQVPVPPSPEVQAIEPTFRADRVADLVIDVLDRRFRDSLAVLAEDAHWADPASLALLTRLAAAAATRPWLVLAAMRTDEGDVSGLLPDAEEIELGALGPEALRALVLAATEAAPLRPHEVALIVERSGGNVLFLEQMIQAARELGSVDQLPETLHAALSAQVDALDPTSRRILRYASVLGRSFRSVVGFELLRGEGIELDKATRARLAAYLVADGPDRLRFTNGLLRDAVYNGLAYRLRSRLHGVAGDAIERISADPAADADVLSLHFHEAGDAERTWRYARIAGDRAQAAAANASATALYERALEAARRVAGLPDTERAEVLTRLGDVRTLAGHFDDALDAYRRAGRLLGGDPVARAELLLKRARARERSGAFPSALREVTVARRLLEGSSGEEAARLGARLAAFGAAVRNAQQRHEDSLRRAQEAVELARLAGERRSLGQALMFVDLAAFALGGAGETRHLRDALEIFVELGDASLEAHARGNLGFLALHASRYDEAIEWFQTGRACDERAGDVVGAALSQTNLGETLYRQGRLDEAEAELRDAARVMEACGYEEGATYCQLLLARVMLARGRLDEAESLLAGVDEVFASLGQDAYLLETASARAELLTALGRAEDALELLDAAQAGAGDESTFVRALVAIARAVALLRLEREEDAAIEIEAGLTAADEQHQLLERAQLLCIQAALPSRDPAARAADAAEAERILAGLGAESAPRPAAHLSDA